METTQTAQAPAVKAPAIIAGKFNGMLSPFQVAAFGTMVYFGIGRQTAHKVANDFGSDLGNAMKSSPDFAAKVGKAKKDGDAVIKFTGKGSNTMTYAMSIVRVVQTLEGLVKEGLLAKASMKHTDFTPEITDYLNDCESWAGEQEWK